MKYLYVLLILLATPALAVDADNDGVDDRIDNCLDLYNADQIDADNDGFGNWCDGDFNNDGVVNFNDLSVFRSNFGSTDAVTDLTGNGVVNFGDLARLRLLFGSSPGPAAVIATRLAWTAPTLNEDNTPLTDLAGYNVYCADQQWEIGPLTTSWQFDSALSGEFTCKITAFDEVPNESTDSEIVTVLLP